MSVANQFRTTVAAPRPSELGFRRLLEKLPAAAYTCDRDGLITYFNRRAAEVWGREPKLNDPVDRFCGSFRLFAPDGTPIDHDRCWMALTLFEDQEYNGHEIVVERPDGARLTVLAHANPIHDAHGRLTGAVNVLVDITDRKQAENALRDADQRKDEFLAILAHELRNPLAPIRNALQLLRLDGDDPALREQVRGMMERQLEHMVRLVDDLLDVSRINRNQLVLRKERVDLAAVVQSAVEATRPLIAASGHELIVTLPTRPVTLDADLTRLAQVFANLLNNAAKYTAPGGRIRLTARRDGASVVVSVKDTGIGIPAAMLPKVFEMFTQVDRSFERTQGGLGIGLSLVRQLVEMHGGTVEARSDGPGLGSEFLVRLPVLMNEAPRAARTNGAAPKVAAACPYRVLVVDDNQDSANSLGKLLRLLGNEVRVAHDGLAAVDAAAEFQPDVVLLDIGLPKLNGYDVARRVRAQPGGESAFLIALTGWGQDEDKRRSAAAGFNLHMVKPVDPTALENLLAGLRRSRA